MIMNRFFNTFLILSFCSLSLCAQRTEREYVRKGNKLYKDSLYIKAEENYLKAIDKESGSIEANYNLGNTYIYQQKAKEAAEQYKKAITLQELETRKLLNDKNAKEEDIQKSKERTSMAYHNLGVLYQGSKDYQNAIKAYQQSLRNNPADNETRYNMILAMYQLKQQQQKNQDQDQQKQEKQKQEQKEQQQDQEQQKQEQQDQDEMSNENAEQIIEAAMQDEKDVQERVKKMMQVQPNSKLDKDW